MSKNNINEIFNILRDAQIKSINDLSSLELINNKLVSAKKYPWIADLASMIDALYDVTDEYIQNTKGQLFLVDEIAETAHNNIFNYSCVFPDRMIISAGEFHFLDNKEKAFVDISLFKKLFWGKDLLENNIVRISPFYRCTNFNDDGDFNNSLVEYLTLPESNKSKIAQLDKSGVLGIDQVDFVNKIIVDLPWLTNAKPEDYLEIIEKNKIEFELYNNNLAKLSIVSENTEQFLQNFKQDFIDANINIRQALERKKDSLRKKGISTAIGICLTGIPFVFKDQISDPQIVSSIIGGVSTFEIIRNTFNDISSLKYTGKENPFWVLWKWYDKTGKKKH